MAHVDRKQYVRIFGYLIVLTVLEVGVAYLHVNKTLMVIALIGLALVKATLVALHFMHLGHERPALKLTVALPMLFPAAYALVLISEAAWRLLRHLV